MRVDWSHFWSIIVLVTVVFACWNDRLPVFSIPRSFEYKPLTVSGTRRGEEHELIVGQICDGCHIADCVVCITQESDVKRLACIGGSIILFELIEAKSSYRNFCFATIWSLLRVKIVYKYFLIICVSVLFISIVECDIICVVLGITRCWKNNRSGKVDFWWIAQKHCVVKYLWCYFKSSVADPKPANIWMFEAFAVDVRLSSADDWASFWINNSWNFWIKIVAEVHMG